jgi:hypothetical protein
VNSRQYPAQDKAENAECAKSAKYTVTNFNYNVVVFLKKLFSK